MINIKIFLLLCFCVAEGFSRQKFRKNGPAESYSGPSSYSTSFGSDYPSYGNYGSLMNMKNPQISTSYSTFGPSSEFGSTSYINYPPTVQHVNVPQQFSSNYVPQQNQQFSSSFVPQQNQQYPSSQSSWPSQSYQSGQSQLPSQLFSPNQSPSSSYSDGAAVSQHVEITKPVAVPVYKKFPYPVAKNFPVAIPHPVLVPVPAPYPVNVAVSHPVAVPVFRELRIPIEKEVMYPVERRVPVKVDRPVQYQVEKHYPVYVQKPYPVKVPIVKTIIHKSPKKW